MLLNTYDVVINKLKSGNDVVQGTVVNNVDPLMKSRLRVSVEDMTDSLDESLLPWYPMVQGSTNFHTSIPDIGSRVILIFDDIYNALVLGSIVSKVN